MTSPPAAAPPPPRSTWTGKHSLLFLWKHCQLATILSLSPQLPHAAHRAAAAQARTVLVLAPEGGAGGQDCAAEKQVASLLALKASGCSWPPKSLLRLRGYVCVISFGWRRSWHLWVGAMPCLGGAASWCLCPSCGSLFSRCLNRCAVCPCCCPQTLRESLRANSAAGAADLPPQTIILQSPPAPSPASAAAAASATSLDNGSSAGSVQGGEGGGPAAAATLLRGGGHPVVEAARSLMAASAKPVEFADLDLECTLTNVMAQVMLRVPAPCSCQRVERRRRLASSGRGTSAAHRACKVCICWLLLLLL